MTVHVRTVGTSRSLQEGVKTIPLQMAEGTSVKQLIAYLQLPEWEIGFILINNQPGFKDTILQDQDQVTLIAPLAGG